MTDEMTQLDEHSPSFFNSENKKEKLMDQLDKDVDSFKP